jgi:uncharacterized protein (TIGR04255 family)
MNNIVLNKNGNAIEKVAFIFVLSAPLDDNSIKNIISLYQNNRQMVEEDLPRMQPQNAITFQFGDQAPMSSQNLGGVIFDRLLANGKQEWFVNFSNNFIVIGSNKYTRWEEIWTKAQEYLTFFIPALAQYEILEIGIEYIDEFEIKDPMQEWKKELFRLDSTLLPAYIWSLDDFWHVHQGYFKNAEYRKLNNVNINYLKDELSNLNKVIIQTHHKIILNEPISLNDGSGASAINDSMQSNHNDNKKVMCDLLSSETCKELSLKCDDND